MEVEVLDLSQKPNCDKEMHDFPTAMDLSQKVVGSKSSIDDEDDEMVNQLLAKLNDDDPSNETIDACKKLLSQLDEKLRNEEIVEVVLAQMKLSQKSIAPSSNRINGISQSTNNGSSNYSRTSNSEVLTNSNNNNTVPINSMEVMNGNGSTNRNSSNQNNSGKVPNQTPNVTAVNNSTPINSVVSTSGQQRMTREMAMQALDQQYMARKALLRKQADKALSEIPLARPPQNSTVQSDLNIIPSTATNEFVALVGLEEVVRNLQEFRSVACGHKIIPERPTIINPFTCVQCGTDFTPLWKRERQGSTSVVCENCCGLNYRKAIQKDYQDKIRMVLKKYQDQERDLDRDYKDMLDSPKKFELFRKEQEKKMLAMSGNNSTANSSNNQNAGTNRNSNPLPIALPNQQAARTSTTGSTQSAVNPNSNTTSRISSHHHHHQQQQQQQQHHHQHHHHHRSTTGPTNGSTTTTSTSSSRHQQQNQQNNAAAAAVANQTASQVAAAAALSNSQLTMDQLAYMQMIQTISQLGSSSNSAAASSRQQQQQLMQQILQVAYMSSAAAAANNPFVQLISNMAAGLISNQQTVAGLANGSTPNSTGGNPTNNDSSQVTNNSSTQNSNAVLSYYLSMLQQQQAAGNLDK